jgi:hypothetical protein
MLSSLHWYQEYNDETLERTVLQIIANTNNRFEMETHYVFAFYWRFLKSVGRLYTFWRTSGSESKWELSQFPFLLALGLLLHYYCFDCFGFPLLYFTFASTCIVLIVNRFSSLFICRCTGFSLYFHTYSKMEPVTSSENQSQFQC